MSKPPARVLRFAGLVAVAILWATVGLGMARSGLGLADTRPLSHLGTDPRTSMLFLVGLITAAILLACFAWAVSLHLVRPTGFLTVFVAGMACQAVVAVVPIDGAGASPSIHSTAGIALGLSLPLLMWRFAASQASGPWRRKSYGLLWLEVAGCVAGVALSLEGRATLAEAAPACLFHLWIIVVTLRWPSWRAAADPRSIRPVPIA